MVMAMREGVLPQTLHVDEPSPHVDWSAGRVELLTEARAWDTDDDRPRRAAVSAFGIGGTNAHVILEQAPEEAESERGARESGGLLPWVVSAQSVEALSAQARRLAGVVGGLDPVDVGWSLAAGRAALEQRAVVWGADAERLRDGLLAVADAAGGPGLVEGRLAVLFTGQGAQRARMGAGLAA
ncbi:ketoacyl-synthetase C-terminal extension domain-containing protein, partial [Streptomyces capparidis]